MFTPPRAAIPQTSLAALAPEQWRQAVRGRVGERKIFGMIEVEGWRGHFLRELPLPRPWSRVNGLSMTREQWLAAMPVILAGLEADWDRLKADHSGTVSGGEITLDGRPLQVVAKRPRRTRMAQWAVDLFRPARARRSWIKTWKLLVRGLPTEVPLLVMERRRGPVVLDNLILFEHVPGTRFDRLDLQAVGDAARRQLLRQVGATIRLTERFGFTHLDAKTTNWIAFEEQTAAGTSLRPVMLDCDGVRHYSASGAGLKRFLKALARHPQFHPADAIQVCEGYAPQDWSKSVRRLCAHYGNKGEGRADAALEGRALAAAPAAHDPESSGG